MTCWSRTETIDSYEKKVSAVRHEAIKALNSLMVPAHLAGLRLFSDRFKGRILEMASSESDAGTRLLAIDVTLKLGSLDLLDEEDASCIIPLLFDSDLKVRQGAAPLIPGLLKDKQLTESDEAPAQLKLFCQLLLDSMVLARDESADASQSLKTRQWDDLDFEEEDMFRARMRDRKALIHWFTKTCQKPATLPFGLDGMKGAVEALWSVLPLVQVSCKYLVLLTKFDSRVHMWLQDWEAMGDFLAESQVDEDSPVVLSADQETCLAYLLFASLTVTADHASGRQGNPDSMTALTRGLMKLIPLLLRKYKNDYTEGASKLSTVLRLVRLMDFEMYLSLRMHTVSLRKIYVLSI
jgi:cohesin complex subunit SA-1/2